MDIDDVTTGVVRSESSSGPSLIPTTFSFQSTSALLATAPIAASGSTGAPAGLSSLSLIPKTYSFESSGALSMALWTSSVRVTHDEQLRSLSGAECPKKRSSGGGPFVGVAAIEKQTTKRNKPPATEHASLSASKASSGHSVLPKKVLEELNCSLCLGLQVESVVLIPCGHSLCKSCAEFVVEMVADCPNCRCKVTGVVPNLPLARFISVLATANLLPNNDVIADDERFGESEDDAILIE